MQIPAKVIELRDQGALFVVNHSGGKDSQALYALVHDCVPEAQILVIHADLPGADWPGTTEHVQKNIHENVRFEIVRAGKTFFQMVESRGMFPSPKYRQCTSDLKRNPIEKAIRRYLAANPRFHGVIVNCMGMRAQESSARSKLTAFKRADSKCVAGRDWYEWLPVFDLSETEVFEVIRAHGQEPHPVYGYDYVTKKTTGMTRLSCCFCIMASKADLKTAARLQPELYARYCATEKKLNFTLVAGKSLPEITGIEPTA